MTGHNNLKCIGFSRTRLVEPIRATSHHMMRSGRSFPLPRFGTVLGLPDRPDICCQPYQLIGDENDSRTRDRDFRNLDEKL
jgi:hypothetical protein